MTESDSFTTHWNMPVTDIRPGDIWYSDKTDVEITDVDRWSDDVLGDMVRLDGRIIRGHGKGNEILQWSWNLDHKLDIKRPL